LAVHENRKVSEKKVTKVQVIEFDEEFFKGKNCICFDDVLTSGKSWAAFGHKLEEFGANVVAGFFLSKTTYKVA
jgi:orotate phosphoribosyltransferase